MNNVCSLTGHILFMCIHELGLNLKTHYSKFVMNKKKHYNKNSIRRDGCLYFYLFMVLNFSLINELLPLRIVTIVFFFSFFVFFFYLVILMCGLWHTLQGWMTKTKSWVWCCCSFTGCSGNIQSHQTIK